MLSLWCVNNCTCNGVARELIFRKCTPIDRVKIMQIVSNGMKWIGMHCMLTRELFQSFSYRIFAYFRVIRFLLSWKSITKPILFLSHTLTRTCTEIFVLFCVRFVFLFLLEFLYFLLFLLKLEVFYFNSKELRGWPNKPTITTVSIADRM